MPEDENNPVAEYLGSALHKAQGYRGMGASENIAVLERRLEFLRALVLGGGITGIGTLFFVSGNQPPSAKVANFIKDECPEVVRVLTVLALFDEAKYVQELAGAIGKAWHITPEDRSARR